MSSRWQSFLQVVIGVLFFVASGWLGQFSFTVSVIRALDDNVRSGQFRTLPDFAYQPGRWMYGLTWTKTTAIVCPAAGSTCVGAVPTLNILEWLGIVAVFILEFLWLWLLVRRAYVKK